MKYRIYIDKELIGLEVIEKCFDKKKDFYEFIGRVYLTTMLHINSIWYEVLE